MKPPRRIFLSGVAATCAVMSIGCATTQITTQNRERMLVTSGFKLITPKTPAQRQKLQKLPPGKVTMIQKAGKTYYIFPDPANNLAYVGGPKQYRNTSSCALTTSLQRRISKPLRCTRTRRWSGVYGVEARGSGDQWEGRNRFDASRKCDC
jgi:hypothetical protein